MSLWRRCVYTKLYRTSGHSELKRYPVGGMRWPLVPFGLWSRLSVVLFGLVVLLDDRLQQQRLRHRRGVRLVFGNGRFVAAAAAIASAVFVFLQNRIKLVYLYKQLWSLVCCKN